MSYEEIHANQLENFLQKPNVVLIDTRDIHSFNAGHIEGALHIDGPTMGRLIKQRSINPPVLVYCYHGILSRDIAEMIASFGFNNVNHLAGGWEAWANYRVQADKNTPMFDEGLVSACT